MDQLNIRIKVGAAAAVAEDVVPAVVGLGLAGVVSPLEPMPEL